MKQNNCYINDNIIYIVNKKMNEITLEQFSKIVQNRMHEICKLLNIEYKNYKLYYCININDQQKVYGYGLKNYIYVFIQNEFQLLEKNNPVFIHEEVHNITLNIWPNLNDLLLEGIAEYCYFNFCKKEYAKIYKYYYAYFHKYTPEYLLDKTKDERPQLNYLGNILIHYIVTNYSINALNNMLLEYSESQDIKKTNIFEILVKNFYNVLYYSIGNITLRIYSKDDKINLFSDLFSKNEELIMPSDEFIETEIVDYNDLNKILTIDISKKNKNFIGVYNEFEIRFFYESFIIIFDYKIKKITIGISRNKITKSKYLLFTQIKELLKNYFLSKNFSVIHGALLTKNNKSILIVGAGGTGKSTMACKLYLNEEFDVINDDIIVFDYNNYKLFGRTNSIFLTKETLNLLNINTDIVSIGCANKYRLFTNNFSKIIEHIDLLVILSTDVEKLKIINKEYSRDLLKQVLYFNNMHFVNKVIDNLLLMVDKCLISSYLNYDEIIKNIK